MLLNVRKKIHKMIGRQTACHVSQQTVVLFGNNSWRRHEATGHFAFELSSFVHLERTMKKLHISFEQLLF